MRYLEWTRMWAGLARHRWRAKFRLPWIASRMLVLGCVDWRQARLELSVEESCSSNESLCGSQGISVWSMQNSASATASDFWDSWSEEYAHQHSKNDHDPHLAEHALMHYDSSWWSHYICYYSFWIWTWIQIDSLISLRLYKTKSDHASSCSLMFVSSSGTVWCTFHLRRTLSLLCCEFSLSFPYRRQVLV